MKNIQGYLLVCLVAASGHADAASYFVQPIVQVLPGSLINGLTINGSLQRSEEFNNAPTSVSSIVNLADGTIKGNTDFTGGTPNGGFSQGRFGERITVIDGVGTTLDLEFSVDGRIMADAVDPALNNFVQIEVDAYFAVFAPSTGANSSTWFNLSFGNDGNQSLASGRFTLDFSNPEFDLDEFVNQQLLASLVIEEARQSFDIFANLTLITVMNGNPGSVSMDFLGTGSFFVDTEPGVTYTSLSGEFLDSTGVTVIPLPAAAWLTLSGLGLLAGLRRRQRYLPLNQSCPSPAPTGA